MDPSMSEEEVRKYIHSFANDGRNPPSTVFNVFQTALKLFNGGGGSALNSHWNYPIAQDKEVQVDMPKIFMDDVDIVCPSHPP
jgi:hypothetical protein